MPTANSRIVFVHTAAKVSAGFNKPLAYRSTSESLINYGRLVRVPLGNRLVTGIVGISEEQLPEDIALKEINSVFEPDFCIPEALLNLIIWSSRYYHTPPGQVIMAALPKSLLDGRPVHTRSEPLWETHLSKDEIQALKAPKQRELLTWLTTQKAATTRDILSAGFGRHILSALRNKKLVCEHAVHPGTNNNDCSRQTPGPMLAESPLEPNPQQRNAIDHILKDKGDKNVFLLEGVTGSGKTEVYLQVIAKHLEQGQQVLFLVPEIGLVTQTLDRVSKRFRIKVHSYHSASSESEKISCWKSAKKSEAHIVIGTRSAIFLPFTNLGLIVVDEEQDLSYKQQEGFRYNARDLSLVRSSMEKCKVILGSATPSCESMHNSLQGIYMHLQLEQRAGMKPMPEWQFVQDPGTKPNTPILQNSLESIRHELQSGNQVLVYLNRRGFAPILQCTNCGWRALCEGCDTAMTLHQNPPSLICHRCDKVEQRPAACPSCSSVKLHYHGMGTEQLEAYFSSMLPEFPCLRIDRDSTQRKGSFDKKMELMRSGTPTILIGTQMITKGHHLPAISLVVALGIDSALFSHDYRALEHLAHSLIQVAGRAGRGNAPGKILIETSEPTHPALQILANNNYSEASGFFLTQRQKSGLPPFRYTAIFHANSTDLGKLSEFMNRCYSGIQHDRVQIIGPMPSAIERKRNRFRYQIQFYAVKRGVLHETILKLENFIATQKGYGKIRWSIDIDPLAID